MGKIKTPKLVTPIASIFTSNEDLFCYVKSTLSKSLGKCIYKSALLPFDRTDYYSAEMGENLKRRIFAFKTLVDPSELPSLKNWTNNLEKGLAIDKKRRVNIDIGYVSLSKLVLATTKDYSHRLYLGKGIYGEVTLRFLKGRFQPWPWTYPDYASDKYCEIFNQIRELHRQKLKG